MASRARGAGKQSAGDGGGLKAAFERKLADSKLDSKIQKKLGFTLRTASQYPSELPKTIERKPMQLGGFVIPYFDIGGKPTKFFRYRYLEQPVLTGFAALGVQKPVRYSQPMNSLNELYLPPLVDWEAVAKDVSMPILITEGELKSACATAHTPYPCIGLGGVWCWKSNRTHQPMLTAFNAFKWDTRQVYIIFDSDAATNPMVMQAENALCKALTDLGAEPYIVRLPAEGGQKVGLDDYIVAQGADELEALLEVAEPWRAAQELHRLNEEVFYVRDPGLILRLDNLQRMRAHDFKMHAFSTRRYFEEQVNAKGKTTLVEKSAPEQWLKWPGRAEVARTTYVPGADRVTAKGELNLWGGWAATPIKGDVTMWNRLLDHIFAKEKEARLWFERWLAWPIQHPGDKLYTCAVIWGRHHGTGKSFIGYSVKQIYGTNWTEIDEDKLRAAHNGWAENKQFVMADEITSGSDNKRGMSDYLKSLVTREVMHINQKFIPTYEIPDRLNWYFTSNHPDAVFLEDDDRRYFIHEVTDEALPDSFWTKYEQWIRRDLYANAPGPDALFYHLLNLDMGDFNPRARAPMTDAKMNMMALGKSELGNWIKNLREDPDSVLRMGTVTIPYRLYRAEDLLAIYDPEGTKRITSIGVARELARQGFVKVANGYGVQTKTNGQCRLWEVRPVPAGVAASNKAAADFYDNERAMPEKKAAARKSKLTKA